jgi:hypothetical protein
MGRQQRFVDSSSLSRIEKLLLFQFDWSVSVLLPERCARSPENAPEVVSQTFLLIIIFFWICLQKESLNNSF